MTSKDRAIVLFSLVFLLGLTVSGPDPSAFAAVPEVESQQSARALKSIWVEPKGEAGILAIIEADGPMEHRVSQPKPDQVVLDIPNVRNPLRHHYPTEPHALVERILMIEYPHMRIGPDQPEGPMARVVFELKKPVEYRVQAEGDRIDVELIPVHSTAESVQSQPENEPRPSSAVDTPWIPSSVRIEPQDIDPALFFGSAVGRSESYRIGPEDVVEIRVFELDQLNRTVRVSGDGTVELPLVGAIDVLRLTAEEVAARVADRLRNRYVQDPQVSVFIKEFRSQNVSLLGAVKSPATYPLLGRRNLLQLLADAGGLSDAGTILYVFRQTDDGRSARLTIPLNELLVQGDPRWNIWLLSGDVVSVPSEEAISVSVLGAVIRPGIHKIPVGEGGSLLKAIASAGGLNDRASKSGIQIKRRDGGGKEILLKVDLGDVLSGKQPDVLLQEGDVIVVKESFF